MIGADVKILPNYVTSVTHIGTVTGSFISWPMRIFVRGETCSLDGNTPLTLK